jgi:glutaredoxin
MGPYQQCPFCETVVELDSDDKAALRRHIRIAHPDEDERETPHHVA